MMRRHGCCKEKLTTPHGSYETAASGFDTTQISLSGRADAIGVEAEM